MALFTDASVVTLEDLLQYEASLVQVASSHGINAETKIAMSMSAIGDKLMLWLLSVGASDPQWMSRRVIGVSTVVVTPALRKWICFDALSRMFAEAYNVQLNTRFQGKWIEYQNEAERAARFAYMSGIGIVYNPLPKPAMPLASVLAGSAPAGSLFAQTTWVDARGNESATSPVNGQILQGSSSLVVAMAEGAVNAPEDSAGWNVYASTTPDSLTLQSPTPLPVGSTWQLPDSGLVQGRQAGAGQTPEYYIILSQQIRRG